MIKLMNSTMMPNQGYYSLQQITAKDFAVQLADSPFESSVGYPDTAREIESIVLRETGKKITVPVSREKTILGAEETILVCKLKYRVANPREKGRFRPESEEYEFYRCNYNV